MWPPFSVHKGILLQPRNDWRIRGKEIVQLFRVLLQIVKLIRIIPVANPFVAAIIYGDAVDQLADLYLMARRLAALQYGQKGAGVHVPFVIVHPRQLQAGWRKIHQLNQRVRILAFRLPRKVDG